VIIGILECWTNRSEWVEEHGDFADWFPPFLRQARSDLDFQVFHAHLGDLPICSDLCDGWLVTGSSAGVNDDLPWQHPLIKFLRECRGIRPVIGVCYGHQLLHSMYGGVVEKASGWGVGRHSYQVLEDRFDGLTELHLLASHQDQVVKPASDSRILAGSSFCPIAATEIGDDIITIQPHPELTPALAQKIYSARREVQGDDLTRRALASIHAPIDDAAIAHWLVSYVRRVTAAEKETSLSIVVQ